MPIPTYAIVAIAIGAFALLLILTTSLVYFIVVPNRCAAILPIHRKDVQSSSVRASYFFRAVVEPLSEYFDFSRTSPCADPERGGATTAVKGAAFISEAASNFATPSLAPTTRVAGSQPSLASLRSTESGYSAQTRSFCLSEASAHNGDCQAVPEGAWLTSGLVSPTIAKPAPLYMGRSESWNVGVNDIEHFDALCNRPLRFSQMSTVYDERQVRHAIGRKQVDWEVVTRILNYKPEAPPRSSGASSFMTFEEPAEARVKRPYAVRTESWCPTRAGIKYWDTITSRRRYKIPYGNYSRQDVMEELELRSKDVDWEVVREILTYEPESRNWLQRNTYKRNRAGVPLPVVWADNIN